MSPVSIVVPQKQPWATTQFHGFATEAQRHRGFLDYLMVAALPHSSSFSVTPRLCGECPTNLVPNSEGELSSFPPPSFQERIKSENFQQVAAFESSAVPGTRTSGSFCSFLILP